MSPPQQRMRGHITTGRRGRNMVLQEIPPQDQWSTVRRNLIIQACACRARGLFPTPGTPTLGTCTRKMSSQITWPWKPGRLICRKAIELQETDNLLLKGLHADHPTQLSVQKQQSEKRLDHIGRILIVNLKASAGDSGVGTPSWGGDNNRGHFYRPPIVC